MATQAIYRCQTPEGADVALRDIETFMDRCADIKLNDPKEFRHLFDSIITPQTKVKVCNCVILFDWHREVTGMEK